MQDTVEKLKAILGPGGFSTDPADIAPCLEDWRGKFRGRSSFVAMPSSAAEVATMLAACNESGMPGVPQSGNTGLVGGQIPTGGEIVLSLKRLNKIREVDTINHSMILEAGVVLEVARNAAEEAGLMLPLSMASQGSCMGGGVASTNAGGVNVL